MHTLLSPIGETLQGHPYLFLFIGLLAGGETVLLPAVYAAFVGIFNIFAVAGIAIAAALLSDSVWYSIGRFLPFGKLNRFSLFKKNEAAFSKISAVFEQRGLVILFVSKFVYGTRIIVQILSGTFRLPYFRYLAVDAAGTVALLGLIFATAALANKTIGQINILGFRQLAFVLFIGLVILLQSWIKNFAKKRWFR